MSARRDPDSKNQQFSWLIYNFDSYLFFKLNIESIFKQLKLLLITY
jgi:hypothetical protein